MAGAAAADLLVGRLGLRAPGVADLGPGHARDAAEGGLDAPEATGCKCCSLHETSMPRARPSERARRVRRTARAWPRAACRRIGPRRVTGSARTARSRAPARER